MYATRPALRFLLILGTFGLAVLSPAKGTFPTVWVMVVLLAPLVLLELGAGIEDEARSGRTLRLAVALQLAGGIAFVFALGLAGGWHGRDPHGSVVFGAALASPGAAVAFAVLRDALSRIHPPRLPPPPAPSRLRASWFVMLTCLGFVLAQVFIGLRRPELTRDPMFVAGLLFFGGGFVFVLSLELDRALLTRGGARLRLARDLAQVLGLATFGLGFMAFAATERPPVVVRGLLSLFGAALLLAGGWLGLRRFLGLSNGLSYAVCREGLLERTKRHALLYPFEAIAAVWLGEVHGQSALHLSVDPEARAPVLLWRRRGRLEELAAKRQRAHRTSEAIFGASLTVLSISIDQDLATLFEALVVAHESPERRAELPTLEELGASIAAPPR